MATDINTLKESRNLLDEITVKLDNMKKGYTQANTAQIKGMQDYKQILEQTLDGEKQINTSIKDRSNLISSLADGNMSLADIAEQRVKIQKRLEHHNLKEGSGLHTSHVNNLGILDTAEKRLKTQGLIDKSMELGDDLTGGMLGKGKDMLGTFKNIGGGAMGAMTLGLTAAVMILIQFSGKLDAIGKQFGAPVLQSKELTSNLLNAEQEATRLGKGLDEVLAVTTALTDEFGIGLSEAIKTSSAVVDLSSAIGVGDGEAAKLVGNFKTLVGLSTDQSVALAKNITLLSMASDVAPQAVLRDLAGSSEQVALFTDATGTNIARGAIQARKMGLEFSTLADSAKSLTNFQDTLSNALTAELLTGKQINTNRLMRLSVEGDLEGLAKEQKKILGDSAAFSKMDLFQREAIAKAVGLTVDQAAKLVNKQEEAVTLAGALAGQPGFDDLIGSEGISTLTQLKGTFASIAATLVNGLGPALNVVLKLIQSILGAAELVWELSGSGAIMRLMGGQEAGYGKGVKRGFNTMAQNTIPGQMGMIPSLDGEGFVEETGVAKVHAGESVGVFNSDGIIGEISSLKSEMVAMKEALSSLKLSTKITNKELSIVLAPQIG